MAQAPPLVVVIHRVAALSALFLRSLQLARLEGTPGRRELGGTWVALMLAVAISSSWIPRFLELTWIPLFTLLTLFGLPVELWSAHRGDVAAHRRHMKNLYLAGMVIAGIFTLLPGRFLGHAAWNGVRGHLPRA